MEIAGFKFKSRRWWQLVVGVAAVILAVDAGIYLITEWLWFQDVNYLSIFRQRVLTQVALFVLGFGLSLLFTWNNMSLALQLKPLPVPESTAERQRGLSLRQLLSLSIGLGLLVAIQLFYQGQAIIQYWNKSYSLYNPAPPLPLWPKPGAVASFVRAVLEYPWQLGVIAAIALAMVLAPRSLIRMASLLMSFGFGLTLAIHWSRVLLAISPASFPNQDPIFGRNIGFYIFQLPVWEILEFWLIGVTVFTLVTVMLVYLLADNSLSRGRFYGFSGRQQRHLYGLSGCFFLVTSLSHWLGRYRIFYSQEGVVYGAGYTDVSVTLRLNVILSLLALLLGLAFCIRFIFWPLTLRGFALRLRALRSGKPILSPPVISGLPVSSRPLVWGIGFYLFAALMGATIAPALVQRFIVQPNELVRESPYIANSIELTRTAFDLTDIEVQSFDPAGELTVEDLQQNSPTLENVRLWDTQPLLESNRQLQEIRLYYEFKDADMDRYTILNSEGGIDRRQVIVSARELNYEQVPDIAKTWVNEHMVYTHGYGFTMSPVNIANPDGLPAYFVRGIDQTTSSEAVRQSIPIGYPRTYFGELTDTFLLTNTKVPELDYPSGDEEVVYTTYAGRAGIYTSSLLRRLALARRMHDWRMLFSNELLPESRLLFRRNIAERVRAIAPFLRFDIDPYLVVADIEDASSIWGSGLPRESFIEPTAMSVLRRRNPNLSPVNYNIQTGENYLYWIIDAYTVSDHYPYSDPSGKDFNYIQNSVKVVVDAYNGSVAFFVSDPDDPMIQSWQRLQPNMFQPLEAMPTALRDHIRYPQDLFQVQSDVLTTYHMTDIQEFYNREDQWRAPNEIYRDEAQQVPPYYVIMRLPEGSSEEFILLRLFTPARRNNLVAWLAARSDGENYGRRLLYSFPRQELVFGPEQIEARINQDPAISQRITLWNTQRSRAQQGHLLVIPIERSLLYFEPLYLIAEQNQLPALARVIVVYGDRIAMAETLDASLRAIFSEERPTEPPILRELNNLGTLEDFESILLETSDPLDGE